MDEPLSEPGSDLREYLRILRNRKWSVLVTIVLVVGAALAYSFLQTPLYDASTRVLVRPIGSPGSSSIQQPVDVETESQVIASEPVATLVMQSLEANQTVQGMLSGLHVEGANSAQTSFSTAQVLSIRYTSADAQFAAEAADAFAEDYIEYRRQQAVKAYTSAQNAVQRRIQTASEQVNELADQLKTAARDGDDALVTALETQRAIVIARLGVLQQRMDDLEPDRTIRSGGAEIIESAVVPSSPASPNILKNGLLALGLAIMLGTGIGFLRERLDDRIRTRADLERATGAPVLAAVPTLPQRSKKKDMDLVVVATPRSHGAEAYRSLRTNLQFMLSRDSMRSLLITSPSAAEGKSLTTANLGVSLARAGKRTVLVSADLRLPTLTRYFQLSNEPGLSTFLMGETEDLEAIVRDPGIPNLRIIASGAVPPNPAELLVTPELQNLLGFLEQNSDLVIFDSPPILSVADAAILTSVVDGTLLVADARTTRRSAVVHAREEIERGGGRLIGGVLNAYDPTSSPYYYASGYYYGGDGDASSKNGDHLEDGESSRRRQSLRS